MADETKAREPKDVTILIVDDEDLLREATAFAIKRKGYNVLEAHNGLVALEILRKQKVDIVLSDIRMPECDGVQLLDTIKVEHPEMPVVMFITGYSDLSLEDAYDKGAHAVFAKPFERKSLLGAIERVLATREQVWGARKFERLETNFSIELQLKDWPTAVKGRVMNIGQGGIFVALTDQFPPSGTVVQFAIYFDQSAAISVVGEGIVRWVRGEAKDGLPPGCGIEFDLLSDSSRGRVIQLINEIKTKAFIPKA